MLPAGATRGLCLLGVRVCGLAVLFGWVLACGVGLLLVWVWVCVLVGLVGVGACGVRCCACVCVCVAFCAVVCRCVRAVTPILRAGVHSVSATCFARSCARPR